MNHALLHLNRPVAPLIGRARIVLGMTQQSLGEALESSKRTAHRWESGKAVPSVPNVRKLAALVFPHDAALAGELASATSTTLADLGLVKSPPPAPAPPPPPPPPPLPARVVVHAVVCVAADELAVPPDTVRRALHAAFKCARELRLSVADVEQALEPETPKERAGRSAR